MIQVNLLPQVKKDLMRARVIKNRVILASIAISIVSISALVLLAVYTYGYQNIRSETLSGDIDTKSKEFLATKDLSKILTIQNQLATISNLNKSRNIVSRFSDMMAKITPPAPNGAKYSSISIDTTTKTITISGQTSGFPAYETLKKTLASAVVKYNKKDSTDSSTTKLATTITITDPTFAIDSTGARVLSFTLKFKYASEFLSPESKNVVVVIEGSGNVTDSYQGIPQSLFVNKPTAIEGGS